MPSPGMGTPMYKIKKGVPAAVVRSYKEPLYDSEDVLAAAPANELELFQRPVGQNTTGGTLKTLLQTNMRTAGQLGTPSSFDVWGFNVRYPKAIDINDYTALTTNGVFSFLIGTDTNYLTVPIEDVPSGVDTQGVASPTLFAHIGSGDTDNFYRFDVSGQGIHINSTESFRCRITFPSGNAGIEAESTLVRVYIRGITYRGI